ncbi:hypothetical protein JAAARDRAFT_39360 [Jaapia argillacea MUCL 33604]|uniref:Uncharacterized protein n=1 Tax=Jaapia argillacea MUCL 33604 TaxID=933084 RepID=A0A067PSJ1_9AGAM|nr:hypothetical protein JAAARDRAFT_39360 [Jaapia argillacea MUCL 33604]
MIQPRFWWICAISVILKHCFNFIVMRAFKGRINDRLALVWIPTLPVLSKRERSDFAMIVYQGKDESGFCISGVLSDSSADTYAPRSGNVNVSCAPRLERGAGG